MSPKNIGRRIRELRLALGLSVPALAKKARIDRSDMWRIENGLGPNSMTTRRLERIAKALGVSLSVLLDPHHEQET